MFGTHGDSRRALQAAGFCSGKRTETRLQPKRGGGWASIAQLARMIS